MTHSSKTSKAPPPLRRRGAARVIPEASAGTPADDRSALVEHPDGWYWVAADGHQQFGPFATPSLALQDRNVDDEQALSEGETIQEAEREIGIGDWIDAQTGAPAEGQSPPHLADE